MFTFEKLIFDFEGYQVVKYTDVTDKLTPEQIKEFRGFKSDARAVAQEFGTSNVPAQPYLRPALESNAQSTVNRLATILKRRIEQYRAKTK
jgi:hypothetical protein